MELRWVMVVKLVTELTDQIFFKMVLEYLKSPKSHTALKHG